MDMKDGIYDTIYMMYMKEDLADNVEEIGGSWGEARHEVPESMRSGKRYLKIIPRMMRWRGRGG